MRWMMSLVVMAVMTGGAQAQKAAAPVMPATVPVMTNKPAQEDTDAMLLARGKVLLVKAATSADGSASEVLNQYAGYYTMLATRTRSGVVELHKSFDDFLIILDGELTETVGGTMENAKEIAPGEVRAPSMTGGTPHVMHKGDVLHIAANLTHQAAVPAGKTVIYYVIKVGTPK